MGGGVGSIGVGGGVGGDGVGGGVGPLCTAADVQLPGPVGTATGWNMHVVLLGCLMFVPKALNVKALQPAWAVQALQQAVALRRPCTLPMEVDFRMQVFGVSFMHCGCCRGCST